MLCERCQQRKAIITVTKNGDDEQHTHHYCEQCATAFYPFTTELPKEPISIQQLLASWQAPNTVRREQVQCQECGYTYGHFRKTGRFGCATCYDTFSEHMPKILKPIQAGLQHVGTLPKIMETTRSIKREIEQRRQQMQEAVDEERFEDAAELRDTIRDLELKLEGGDVSE